MVFHLVCCAENTFFAEARTAMANADLLDLGKSGTVMGRRREGDFVAEHAAPRLGPDFGNLVLLVCEGGPPGRDTVQLWF